MAVRMDCSELLKCCSAAGGVFCSTGGKARSAAAWHWLPNAQASRVALRADHLGRDLSGRRQLRCLPEHASLPLRILGGTRIVHHILPAAIAQLGSQLCSLEQCGADLQCGEVVEQAGSADAF